MDDLEQLERRDFTSPHKHGLSLNDEILAYSFLAKVACCR